MNHEILDLSPLAKKPIPSKLPNEEEWKNIPIRENNELLVPLGPFSDYRDIFTSSIYAGERYDSPYFHNPLPGSLVTQFVRQSVAHQLRSAQELLPYGYFLVVQDAYRTTETQRALYIKYHQELQKKNSDWPEDELTKETQKFVSLPSTDPTKPSPHNTGGAVDLAIAKLSQKDARAIYYLREGLEDLKDEDWNLAYLCEMQILSYLKSRGKLLTFGTPFDYAGEESATNYYERKDSATLTEEDKKAMYNRRLLYHIMKAVGFEAYKEEWWHFNSSKSQMGAKTTGLPIAEYGPIQLSLENRTHELMRRNHRLGSIRIHEGIAPSVYLLNNCRTYFLTASEGIKITGDIRDTSFPKAAIITP